MDTLDPTPPEPLPTAGLPTEAHADAPAEAQADAPAAEVQTDVPAERISFISPPLWAAVAFLVSRMIILTTGWGVISRIGVRAIGKERFGIATAPIMDPTTEIVQ